jgi:hypothetical protein
MEPHSKVIQERKRIYEKTREHTLKSQLSNSENFDRAVLSLATAFLGVSLTFTDRIVPLISANFIWSIYIGWSCFIFAIMTTLVSYLVSQKALKIFDDYAMNYYLEFKDEYFNRTNVWDKWNNKLSYLSVSFFISGVLFTALFLYLNINQMRLTVSDNNKKNNLTDGVIIPKMQNSITIPTNQTGNVIKRGATIPKMQPAPSSTTGQASNPPSSSNSGSTGSKK